MYIKFSKTKKKGLDTMKRFIKVLAVVFLVGAVTTPVFPSTEEKTQECQIINSFYELGMNDNGFPNFFYYLTVDIDGRLELFEIGYDIYTEYMTADTITVQTTQYGESWFGKSHTEYNLIVY